MAKREANLKFPKLFNDSTPVPTGVREEFESIMLKWFGGYTRRDVTGAWLSNDGKTYHDDLYEYVIAAEDNENEIQLLRNLAAFIIVECKQEAVYCRMPSGEVEFIA